MRVVVLSDDPEAARVFCGTPLDAERVPLNSPGPDADVLVWKPGSVRDLPETLPNRAQVFLLPAAELAAFHGRYPAADARVLVYPVSSDVLHRVVCTLAGGSEHDLLELLLLASWRVQAHHAERVNFLARTLHDLRAPLTAACGYCGLLADKCFGPLSQPQADTVARLQRSLLRISALANAAFELSVGDVGICGNSLAAGSLEECVEQAIEELHQTADMKGVEFVVRMSEQPETLRFDSSRMTQVFSNLLENACRFAEPRTAIAVVGYPVLRDGSAWVPACPSEACGYRVDISDSGPGIPPGRTSEIFKEYVSYSMVGDRAGAGLGLAICRLIVEGHKGEVFADARTDGATFSVVLPTVENVAAPPRASVLPIAQSPKFQVRQ